MLNESLLAKELRQWSKDVLEKPNKKFNNLPACPFTKLTWDKNKAKVVLGEGGLWEDLIQLIENFDDTYDVIIYCGTDIDIVDSTEVENRLKTLNDWIVKDNLWVMGSHPETDEDNHAASQEDFEPIVQDSYYTVYLQRLDMLVKASDSIERKGYYKNYSSNNYNKLIKARRKKWLE